MRYKLSLVFLLIALVISPVLAQEEETPVRGGTIRGACVAAITSLDPATSQLGNCDNAVYNLLYNTMVRTTRTGEILPEIATEWEISEDGLTYTFILREGVTFHDGTPVNAEAVVFSLDRMRDPEGGSPSANLLAPIASVEAVDDYTVVITLSSPTASLLSTLGGGLSGSIVSPTAVEALGDDFQSQAVGSGPFRIVSWEAGGEAVFDRNEDYWETDDNGEALPYLDSVVLNGVPDEAVRLLNLQSGEFELNERNSPRDNAVVEGDPALQIIETSTATSYLVAMNVTQPPFDNVTLRQAVSAALNREAIITNIGLGTGYVAPFAYPREAWFFIDEPSPVYDLDQARQLLTEAGYPDGIDITMTIISRPIDEQIAQIVQANLAEVGINVTIESLERTAWVELWSSRSGQMGILQRGASPIDPDNQTIFFDPNSFANFAGYDNAEAFELVQQAREVTDQAERLELYEQLVGILVEEAPYVFIGSVPQIGSARANVRGLVIDPGGIWSLTRTWLASE